MLWATVLVGLTAVGSASAGGSGDSGGGTNACGGLSATQMTDLARRAKRTLSEVQAQSGASSTAEAKLAIAAVQSDLDALIARVETARRDRLAGRRVAPLTAAERKRIAQARIRLVRAENEIVALVVERSLTSVRKLSREAKRHSKATKQSRAALARLEQKVGGVLTKAKQRRAAKPRAPVKAPVRKRATKRNAAEKEFQRRLATIMKAFPSGDVMAALFQVFHEAIDEANTDKKYFLERLAQLNKLAEAQADYLKELNAAAIDLYDAASDC
jgi:hypothetical protein